MKPAYFCTVLFSLLCFQFSFGQPGDSTYAERLGYPRGAKVVILHVDDAGMSYDSNEGVIKALTKGVANSCSVMMPCPWVPGMVHFLKQHPEIDAGLHLTITSEWKDYRWGPLSGKPAVPGLVDKEGDLWPTVEEVVKNAPADEVYREIKAQLERARAMGFEPTHLDSHMGTLFASPQFLERYVVLGIENHIPVMFPAGHATLIAASHRMPADQVAALRAMGRTLWQAGLPVLDDLHDASYGWNLPAEVKSSAKKLRDYRTAQYIDALRSLKPGLTMIIMHCTDTTEVFRRISDSGPLRQADLEVMLNPEFRKALQREGVILTTWRELKQRRDKMK